MKPGRITRRNPDPERLLEVEPHVEVGQLIRRYLGDAFQPRAADGDVAHRGPDERGDEASGPRAEHSPEPETPRLDGSEELAEAALTRAAAERAAALAEREAALGARRRAWEPSRAGCGRSSRSSPNGARASSGERRS